MTPDLQELLALAIVVAVVALNLWLRRRRKRDDPESAAADCASCPKSASEPAATKPRLVQLGGGNGGAGARD